MNGIEEFGTALYELWQTYEETHEKAKRLYPLINVSALHAPKIANRFVAQAKLKYVFKCVFDGLKTVEEKRAFASACPIYPEYVEQFEDELNRRSLESIRKEQYAKRKAEMNIIW